MSQNDSGELNETSELFEGLSLQIENLSHHLDNYQERIQDSVASVLNEFFGKFSPMKYETVHWNNNYEWIRQSKITKVCAARCRW